MHAWFDYFSTRDLLTLAILQRVSRGERRFYWLASELLALILSTPGEKHHTDHPDLVMSSRGMRKILEGLEGFEGVRLRCKDRPHTARVALPSVINAVLGVAKTLSGQAQLVSSDSGPEDTGSREEDADAPREEGPEQGREGDSPDGGDSEGEDPDSGDASGDDASGDDASGDDASGDDASGDDASGEGEGASSEGDDASGDGDDASGGMSEDALLATLASLADSEADDPSLARSRRITQAVVEDVVDDVERFNALSSVLWGDEALDPSYGRKRGREKLAQLLMEDEDIKKLLHAVGALLEVFGYNKSEGSQIRPPHRGTPTGIENVKRVEDLTGQSLGLFFHKHPRVRLSQRARFFSRGLPGMGSPKERPRSKGSFLFALDCSGSMGGYRMETASAFVIACLLIARDEGRSVGGVGFNAKSFSLVPYADPRCPSTAIIDGIETIARIRPSGGTSFEPAAAQILRLIQQEQGPVDVLWVTDGLAPIGPYMKELAETGRIHLVNVGTTLPPGGELAQLAATHLTLTTAQHALLAVVDSGALA